MKPEQTKAPETKTSEPTAAPELKALMGDDQKPAAREREKVLIVNEFGAEATPYKTDLEPWLEQGWKIKEVPTNSNNEGVK